MEKDIALGSNGGIKIKFVAGKASIEISEKAAIADGMIEVHGEGGAILDSSGLIDLIFNAAEAKSPDGLKVYEEMAKQVIINMIKGIA